MSIQVGPERIVLTDGLQPFLFRTSKGTLFLQAQYTAPAGFVYAAKDMIPGGGVYGNVLSRDGGKTWARWVPEAWKDVMPYFEGTFTELADGTLLMVEWVAKGPSRR